MSDSVTPELLVSSSVVENADEEKQRLQSECSIMIQYLKQLEEKEAELYTQNEILVREALVNGFDISILEAPIPKRRKSTQKKQENS